MTPDEQKIKCWLRILAFLLVGCAGFVLIIWMTSKRGVGVEGDGVFYIYMARCLSGLDLFGWPSQGVSLWQHYPPLFPIIMALIHWLGGPDPLYTARWLNAFFFGMNICLVGILLYRYTKNFWLSMIGVSWMLVRIDNLYSYSMAMTEPLFIFLTLLWLFFITDFMETKSRISFGFCSMAAGLACLTRFAGIPLVLTGALLLFFQKDWLKSRIWAVAFGCLSLLPLTLWGVVNFLHSGHWTDRMISFHPLSILGMKGYPGLINHLSTGETDLVLVLMLGMVLLGWMIFRNRDSWALKGVPNSTMRFITIIVFFIFFYFVSWGIVVGFLDSLAKRGRYFLPVEVFELFFCLLCVHLLFSVTRSSRLLKSTFAILLMTYVIGLNLPGALAWGVVRYNEGVAFDRREWDKSAIISEVKKISADTLIYSNNFMALYFLTGRRALPLAYQKDPLSLRPNLAYNDQIKQMKEALSRQRAVLVYGLMKFKMPGMVSEEELKKEIPLKMLVKVADGQIYVYSPSIKESKSTI
ncbi:MAG: hypothetical protein HQL13_00285 [Candidatus Omnitrophica bacterium]|nr:hypothetical protein [Candidatus Omnitrophota bacterium]